MELPVVLFARLCGYNIINKVDLVLSFLNLNVLLNENRYKSLNKQILADSKDYRESTLGDIIIMGRVELNEVVRKEFSEERTFQLKSEE